MAHSQEQPRHNLVIASGLPKIGGPIVYFVPICALLILSAAPIVITIASSFFSWDQDGQFRYIGLTSYKALIYSPHFPPLLLVMLRAFLISLVAMAIALPTAFTMLQIKSRLIQFLLIVVLLIPFLTNDALRAYGWSRLLGPAGPIAPLVSFAIGDASLTSLRFTDFGLGLCMISSVLPFGVLTILASFRRSRMKRWSAARELGSSHIVTFALLFLPAASPGLVAGFLLMFILCTFNSAAVQYTGGSLSYHNIASGVQNVDVNNTVALFPPLTSITFAILCVSMIIAGFALTKRQWLERSFSSAAQTLERRIGRVIAQVGIVTAFPLRAVNRLMTLIFPVIAVVVSVLCFSLVLASVVPGITMSFLVDVTDSPQWTTDHYGQLLNSTGMRDVLGNSISLAIVVGIVSMLLATMLGSSLWARKGFLLSAFGLAFIGGLMPPESYSLSLISVTKFIGVQGGGMTQAAMGHIAWALPFCFTGIVLSFRELRPSMLEAAAELEPNVGRRFTRVVLGACISAIVGALVFGFLLSLNELSRGMYLGGGVELLPIRVFGRLQSGFGEQGAEIFAASGFMTALSIGAVVLGFVAIRLVRWFMRLHK